MAPSTTDSSSSSSSPKKTWKDYFQYFIYFLRALTLISLLMTLVAYIIVIKVAWSADGLKIHEKIFLTLSSLGFVFVVVALMIAEFQPLWFVKRVMILWYWAGRGFAQAWLGIQLVASAGSVGSVVSQDVGGNGAALTTFAEVSGYILLSIGLLLIIMSAMCLRGIVELKADKELEAALLETGSRVVVSHHQTVSSAGDAAADKLKKEVDDLQGLVQNLSTAMGISYVVATSKFGGKAGAQAAENFQRDMKQKEQQLKNAASNAGAAAKQEYTRMSNVVENTANSVASNFSPTNNDSRNSSNNNNTTSSSVPIDDEPVGRRKRAQMDDDELERMYYGNKQ